MNTNSLNSLDTKDAAVFVLEDDTSKEHLFKQHLKVLGGNAERKIWLGENAISLQHSPRRHSERSGQAANNCTSN